MNPEQPPTTPGPPAFRLDRRHGPHAGRFLNIATGDGILVVDVRAALEAIATAEGATLEEAERRGADADMAALKKPRHARDLYARLRACAVWDRCPHGHATVASLSASGPQRIGPFLVRAPWHAAREDTLDIVIEPGLSFGLGTHATTRLPLAHLAQTFRPAMRGADVGCGSGVLGIAMARLGAAAVDAVDRDPTAVAEARDNVRANGVEGIVHPPRAGSARDLTGPFDVITANMGGAPSVVEIAPDVAARLKPGGLFLASGIYGDTDDDARAVADSVAAALRPLGLYEQRRDMERQCVGMVYRREP